MPDADITITLGRSGQVVKRSRSSGGGAPTDYQTFSGSKRARGEGDSRSSGHSSLSGARINRDDLRLKLLRKRMSRSQQVVETQKKISTYSQPSEQSKRSSLRSIPLKRSNDVLQVMGSLKISNPSQTSSRLVPESLDTIVKASAGVSASKCIDGMPNVPSASWIEALGTRRVTSGDVNPSLPRGPIPIPSRTSLDAAKPVTKLPTAGSKLSLQPGATSLNVTSFLHALGLGKYAIHFQAEEVDMTALKQMADRDLKELGLPMGPRKKILIALLSLSKRPTA